MSNMLLPLKNYGIGWNTPEGKVNFDYVGYNDIVKCQNHDGSWNMDVFEAAEEAE